MTQPVVPAAPSTICNGTTRVHADVSLLGVVVLLGTFAAFAAELTFIHVIAYAGGAPVPDPGTPLVYATLVTVLMLVKIVCHELSHVLVGRARGFTWVRWSIRRSGTPSVTLTAPTFRSNLDQLLISIAGPAGDLGYGILLLTINDALALPGWGPVAVAGWTAVTVSVLAFVLPLRASADGMRAWHCLWRVLTGRGRLPHEGA